MTREEAIKRLEVVRTNALIQKANGASEYWQEEIDGTIEAIDMAIEALQADAVSLTGTMKYLTKPHNYCEVVRCKDCRFYSNDHLCEQLSRFGSIEPLAGFYCAFGKRRDS